MSEKRLSLYRRKHLGYIFQMYNLIPNLTVRENIEVGAYLSDQPLPVDDLLNILGLTEHRHILDRIIMCYHDNGISVFQIHLLNQFQYLFCSDISVFIRCF